MSASKIASLLGKSRLPDPLAAAARQIAGDKRKTSWKPLLFERKCERMKASPFAFLRGSASLYYELLKAVPELADGPEGDGWIIGDLHLENFGAFRVEPMGSAAEVVFDPNDFDDAAIAPVRWDLLRLATSLLLAAREAGRDGTTSVALARHLVDSYADTLATGKVPRAPKIVSDLMEKVGERKRVDFLDARTAVVKGTRRFVHGDRYQALPASELPAIRKAIAHYTRGDGGEKPSADFMEVVDVAFRIAGTGSLGCRRYAVLVEGKGSPDGCAIFDFKEEGSASVEVLGIKSKLAPNERVVAGARACLSHPPFAMGTTTLHGRPMLGRRLTPQEDKIEAAGLDADEFEAVSGYYGALAGRAHRRGAKRPSNRRWSDKECEEMVARATVVAGWHHAVYLAWCAMI